MCVSLFVHCSSGMKRLPFSDDEFSSPPNKMARVDGPKKGTVCVFVLRLFTCWSGVFEWCSHLGVTLCFRECVCVCVCVCTCMCVCLLWPAPEGTHHTHSPWAMWLFQVFQNTHTCLRPPLAQQNTSDLYVHTHMQTSLCPLAHILFIGILYNGHFFSNTKYVTEGCRSWRRNI